MTSPTVSVTSVQRNVPTGRSTTGRRPTAKLDKVYTGSGILGYLSDVGRYSSDSAADLREFAALLRKCILDSSKIPLSLDKRVMARRMHRAVLRIAVHQEDAAKAASSGLSIYLGSFGDARVSKSARKEFDPSK